MNGGRDLVQGFNGSLGHCDVQRKKKRYRTHTTLDLSRHSLFFTIDTLSHVISSYTIKDQNQWTLSGWITVHQCFWDTEIRRTCGVGSATAAAVPSISSSECVRWTDPWLPRFGATTNCSKSSNPTCWAYSSTSSREDEDMDTLLPGSAKSVAAAWMWTTSGGSAMIRGKRVVAAVVISRITCSLTRLWAKPESDADRRTVNSQIHTHIHTQSTCRRL